MRAQFILKTFYGALSPGKSLIVIVIVAIFKIKRTGGLVKLRVLQRNGFVVPTEL
jgi:hypothetical protein